MPTQVFAGEKALGSFAGGDDFGDSDDETLSPEELAWLESPVTHRAGDPPLTVGRRCALALTAEVGEYFGSRTWRFRCPLEELSGICLYAPGPPESKRREAKQACLALQFKRRFDDDTTFATRRVAGSS